MTRQEKIQDLMLLAKCDQVTARAYLEAEEWISVTALESLRLDRLAGLLNDQVAL